MKQLLFVLPVLALYVSVAASIHTSRAQSSPSSLGPCYACEQFIDPADGKRKWRCAQDLEVGATLCAAALDGSTCGVGGSCG